MPSFCIRHTYREWVDSESPWKGGRQFGIKTGNSLMLLRCTFPPYLHPFTAYVMNSITQGHAENIPKYINSIDLWWTTPSQVLSRSYPLATKPLFFYCFKWKLSGLVHQSDRLFGSLFLLFRFFWIMYNIWRVF